MNDQKKKGTGARVGKGSKTEVRGIASKGKIVVIWAGGYPSPFETEAEYISALDASSEGDDFFNMDVRLATSEDFEATVEVVQRQHKLKPRLINVAYDKGGFLGPLQNIKGPFRRIVFVGHGSSGTIGFSGEGFFSSETLEKSDFQNKDIMEIIESIKPKILRKKTTIDLYACHVAVEKEFMKTMANAFNCSVRAFNEALVWCVSHNGRKITSRGKIAPASETKKLEGKVPNCKENIWKTVKTLKPDVVVDPD